MNLTKEDLALALYEACSRLIEIDLQVGNCTYEQGIGSIYKLKFDQIRLMIKNGRMYEYPEFVLEDFEGIE